MLKPLIESEIEYLDWKNDFQYPKMCRIRTELNGSSFFHALAKSYNIPYIVGHTSDGDIAINRTSFIKNMRNNLASTLEMYYQTLFNGKIAEMGQVLPEFSFENMKNVLESNQPISIFYNEYISNVIDKDIYLLDAKNQDVLKIKNNDLDILYKGRKSIVILILDQHCELIGIQSKDNFIKTIFNHDDEFIRYIYARLK